MADKLVSQSAVQKAEERADWMVARLVDEKVALLDNPKTAQMDCLTAAWKAV